MGIEASLGKVIKAVSEDSVLKDISKELGSLNLELGNSIGSSIKSLGSMLREMEGKASNETMESFPSADHLLSTFAGEAANQPAEQAIQNGVLKSDSEQMTNLPDQTSLTENVLKAHHDASRGTIGSFGR